MTQRRARRAAVAVALAGMAAAVSPAGAGGARAGWSETASLAPERGTKAPSRMLVNADEWSLVLSRTKLGPGPAIIEMYNRGEDPHNLRVRRAAGGAVRRIAELGPDGRGSLEMRLRRGSRYRLWCSLPAHRERGMKATLRVARKRDFGS